mgnify:CR=1 FL=1|tara:strand:- start:31874 stop:32311 length:438 start_codon:yes stop_codon:yes gene_type:complete
MSEDAAFIVLDGARAPIDVLAVARRVEEGGHRAVSMVSSNEIRALAIAALHMHQQLVVSATALAAVSALADKHSPAALTDARHAVQFLWDRLVELGYLAPTQPVQHMDVSHETTAFTEVVPTAAFGTLHSQSPTGAYRGNSASPS